MNTSATLTALAASHAADRDARLIDSANATRELERFLAEVERRAFRMAQIALRHEEDALDAVQDAMLQLAHRYAARPPAEWKPLFYRILENRIRDLQRRRSVRNRVMAWLPSRSHGDDAEPPDPIEQARDLGPEPVAQIESQQMLRKLEQALNALPARQRQAFTLRNLEGMDVAETASAMGCSEGSVKTHYFRALQALRLQLGEFWR
jgi:RNA polymerase sigma-70 factor (ECF subfamily)